MLYLAIDQHSKQLTVNVRDEAGQVVIRKQVSTRGEVPREFLKQLAERGGADGYVAIVEVCGFNDWLLDLLPLCGCREIVLIQPGEPGKRKTDRRDANQLGELLWVNRHRLLAGQRVHGVRRVNIPGEQERDDRRLAALRHRIGRELTRVINRVQTVLRRRNLQHDCPTKTIQAKRARAWLKRSRIGLDSEDSSRTASTTAPKPFGVNRPPEEKRLSTTRLILAGTHSSILSTCIGFTSPTTLFRFSRRIAVPARIPRLPSAK